MNYKIGDIVRSKAGHDVGYVYIVIAADDMYCFVANGKTRFIDMPKKKKQKHLELIGQIEESLSRYILERSHEFSKESRTGDAKLRSLLKAEGYNNSKINKL